MAAVRPQWTEVREARKALGLDGRVLLHAGPALAAPTRPPRPMLNAAALSCLHEGWAKNDQEAERILTETSATSEDDAETAVKKESPDTQEKSDG